MASGDPAGGRRGAATRRMACGALAALLVWCLAAASRAAADPTAAGPPQPAGAAAAPVLFGPTPGVRVVSEHLVIRPLPGRAGSGFDVLDLLRLEVSGGAAGPDGPLFAVPLPAGHEGLQVLSGLREGTLAVGQQQVRGRLEQPRGRLLTVAVRYRLPASRFPHAWALARPYPVEATVVLLHPDAAVAVAGARAAGELDVEGTPYRAYVSQASEGSGTVVLAPLARPRPLPGPAAAVPVVVLAGALAATWRLVRLGLGLRHRRARPGRDPAGREVDRLVDRVLELDGQYAAGYLEVSRYRQLREAALSQLARRLGGQGGCGGGHR